MSRKAGAPARRIDPRIRRTRDRLGDALVALVQEKPLDTITVQEVLDRARVGRSTFYVHFRDMNDLFLSDVDEFLQVMATTLLRSEDSSDRVAPVRELFAHVADMHRLYAALVESGRIHDFLDLARGHFARAIERRLAGLPRASGITAERRAAVAHAFAGALLSLLTWWIDNGMSLPPAHMDDLYHRMVWAGAGSGGSQPSQR